MEKEIKLKECYRCKYFDKFFVKGVKQFMPTKCGWCSVRLTVKNLHDGCKFCEIRPRKKVSKLIAAVALSKLLTEITELHNLIREDINDNKELDSNEQV